MTELLLSQVSSGPLLHATFRFGPGSSVILGDDAGTLAVLVALASGSEAPPRGRALLDGALLDATPAARRRVASLFAEEALPPARSVEQAVSLILEARRDPREPQSVLRAFGLERLSARSPTGLDWDEQRSVALALALAHDRAEVLALYEPLGTSSIAPAAVREGVARAIGRGAVVLLATTSSASAATWSGPTLWLERGVLREAPLPPAPDPAFTPSQGERPQDQVVSLPTSFADPRFPSRDGGGS